MKIKENFVLQEIAEEGIVVPIGNESDVLHGVVKLNSAGLFLWKQMVNNDQNRESLSSLLANEFAITQERAQIDVDRFLLQLRNIGCIED